MTKSEIKKALKELHKLIQTTTTPGESDRLIRRSHDLMWELRELEKLEDC